MEQIVQAVFLLVVALAVLLFFGPIIVIISIIGYVEIGPLNIDLRNTGQFARIALGSIGLLTWLSIYLPLISLASRGLISEQMDSTATLTPTSIPTRIEATQTAVAYQVTIYHPDDATSFSGHYYKVYSTKSISWSNAKSQCESQQGYLTVITSRDENEFVWNLTLKNKYPEHTVAWIGATDNSSEGNWKWVTGESFNALSNLVTGGGTYENYLNLRLATGKWEDFPLNGEQVGEQWYICEWGQ